MSTVVWRVEVMFEEDEQHTRAEAVVDAGATEFRGVGRASRAPGDPGVSIVGEQLAASRALADLSHKLLAAAVERIERF